MSIHTGLQELNIGQWVELPRRAAGETHLVLRRAVMCWSCAAGRRRTAITSVHWRPATSACWRTTPSSCTSYCPISTTNSSYWSTRWHKIRTNISSLREHFPSAIPLERAAERYVWADRQQCAPGGALLAPSWALSTGLVSFAPQPGI